MVGEVKAPDEGGRLVYILPWEWRKLQRSAARCYLVVAYVNSARSVHLLVLGSLHNSQICANGCEGGM